MRGADEAEVSERLKHALPWLLTVVTSLENKGIPPAPLPWAPGVAPHGEHAVPRRACGAGGLVSAPPCDDGPPQQCERRVVQPSPRRWHLLQRQVRRAARWIPPLPGRHCHRDAGAGLRSHRRPHPRGADLGPPGSGHLARPRGRPTRPRCAHRPARRRPARRLERAWTIPGTLSPTPLRRPLGDPGLPCGCPGLLWREPHDTTDRVPRPSPPVPPLLPLAALHGDHLSHAADPLCRVPRPGLRHRAPRP